MVLKGMIQTVSVNNTALCSCHKAVLFQRCVGVWNIQQGGYWMFKGACRLDDLAHRTIILIYHCLVNNFFIQDYFALIRFLLRFAFAVPGF
jgi:hypothetical protein